MADMIELRNGLDKFRAARDRILKDADLTPEAKIKRANALKKEALAELTRIGEAMWRGLESEFKAAEAASRLARQQANAGWDFQRLAYDTGTLPSLLAGLRNVGEIASLYETIKLAGDPYKARAFREHVPGLLAGRNFAGEERVNANSLILALQRDAEDSLMTPAVKKADANAGALIERILEAKEVTQAVINEFALGGSVAFPGEPHPLLAWLQRLKIERETLPSDPLKQITRMEFSEPESRE